MIDEFVARLQRPRYGILLLTALISLLMSTHWSPMAVPSLALLGVCLLRPTIATRSVTWWLMALAWFGALVLAPERMEDHVPLFMVWLVALAVCLRRPDEEFVAAAAFQARMLIGVTFAAAVAWKLWFGTYLNGVTLWMYMVADDRFQPLATGVGLSEEAIEATRQGISRLLTGSGAAVPLEASDLTVSAIVVVSVLTLVLEAVIALSHLAPDSSRLAHLRLPSIVVFGVVTYGTVPVVPFAALLALLAMTIGHWHPRVLWVLPAFMIVIATRVTVLAF